MCFIAMLLSCKEHHCENIISDTNTLLVTNLKEAIVILDSLEQVSDLNEKEQMHLVCNRALAH